MLIKPLKPLSLDPGLHAQSLDPLEFTDIASHERGAFGERLTGDPEIVGADGSTRCLEMGELFGVTPADQGICWVEDGHLPRELVESTQDVGFARTTLGTLEQFGIGDERHADSILDRQGLDTRRDAGRAMLDQIDQDFRIEHVCHRLSRSCRRGCWLFFSLRFERGDVSLVEAFERLQQRSAPIVAQRMEDEIAICVTADLNTLGVKPEFSRDTHGLAVAVHEDTGNRGVHDCSECTYVTVCMMLVDPLQSRNDWSSSPEI